MVKIEFFLEEKSLGVFECIEASSPEDRDRVAEQNGIVVYDKMILDDGRVVMVKMRSCFVDHKGQIWNKTFPVDHSEGLSKEAFDKLKEK